MDKQTEEIFAKETKDLVENPTPLEVSTQTGSLEIEGLEDVPASIMPIPFLRLVQPSSTKIETANGKEAPAGTFFFNDTQTATETIEFALIKAKHGMQTFERDGEVKDSVKLAILGQDLNKNKLFVLTLSVMSFTNFGSLVAKMKEAGITKTWENKIIISSEKHENEKGKYYTARFELGEKLTEHQISELEKLHTQYGTVLDRKNPQSDVEV